MQKEESEKIAPNRQSVRLKGYDYSWNGVYFITICTQDKKCLFGKVDYHHNQATQSLLDKNKVHPSVYVNTQSPMRLNEAGEIIQQQWLSLEKRFQSIRLDAFVVMPNHIHGVIVIERMDVSTVGAAFMAARHAPRAPIKGAPTIGDIIGSFKSLSTNKYIRNVKSGKLKLFEKRLWQRNYYEHIVRSDKSLEDIRGYILNNPYTWYKDGYFKP